MILKLEHISKQFQAPGREDQVTVLKDISLTVNAGESIAVVGPSGSGKSTLLNIIGTLDSPSSGSMLFEDRDISGYSEKALAQFRNQELGFVFQLHHLLPQLTVLENVLLPTLAFDKQKNALDTATDLLHRVGLELHLDHRPAQLSGGEQQRVAVVRALINQPKLLLADEPTGSLDQDSSNSLVDLLVQLNEQDNVTLVVVTHSMELAQRMNVKYKLNKGILNPL